MSIIFAVIDTNVVVSGMITKNPDSPTVGVLASLGDKNITPLYCEEILEEYKSVLNREKFQLPKEKIENFNQMTPIIKEMKELQMKTQEIQIMNKIHKKKIKMKIQKIMKITMKMKILEVHQKMM